jgi:hypothetical protein
MTRRSKVCVRASARSSKVSKSKGGLKPKKASRSTASAADQAGKIARLNRELTEAVDQQTAARRFFELSAALRLIYKQYSTHWPNPPRVFVKPMQRPSGDPMAKP